MIVPTRSQYSKQDLGVYDPWIDLNEDGNINLFDAVMLAGTTGTSGDPTKNVNVMNWPEDRAPQTRKGVEKIVVFDTFSYQSNGYGITIDWQAYDSTKGCWFEFEPMGELVNVTEIYVNVIWRADTETGYALFLTFWNHTNPLDFDSFPLGVVGPNTKAENKLFKASEETSPFNFNLITEGVNRLYIGRQDTNAFKYVYIYKLELFIEYFYLE